MKATLLGCMQHQIKYWKTNLKQINHVSFLQHIWKGVSDSIFHNVIDMNLDVFIFFQIVNMVDKTCLPLL